MPFYTYNRWQQLATVNIDATAIPGFLGATSTDGVLRTSSPLSYTDGGDYITLGFDTTASPTFAGMNLTGKLTVTGGAEGLKLIGTDTGNANLCYIRFYDSDGSTKRGYVGDGSSDNDDIYLEAETGYLRLLAAGYISLGTHTYFPDDVVMSFGASLDYSIGYYSTDDEFQIIDGTTLDTNVRLKLDSSGHFDFGAGNLTTTGTITGTGAITSGTIATAGSLVLYDGSDHKQTISTGSLAGDINFILPTTDGGANEFLQTNGSGTLTWAAGGGLANVVEDATPQLGGDLDLNGNSIDFPSVANVSDCKDEDNMASDSATMLATQQSIKKYVDDSVGAAAGHAILDGSIHTDSVADAVTRGSIIYGNATPKWDELVIGAADTFLGSDGTDASYRTAAQVLASLSGEAGAAFAWGSQNLSAIGTIGCGEITVADGSSINLQEALTFTGATTENLIEMPDNLAVALDITEAGNSYMLFVTTNASETITFGVTFGAITGSTIGNLTLADGSITDSGGSITFNDENISTTGTLGCGVLTSGNIIIPDAGYIGSVSDTDAIQIEADGDIVFSQDLAITGTLDVTGTVTIPAALTGVIRADSGVLSVDADVTDIVAAATTTAAGKSELAVIAEVNAGTDTVRTITPNALAGSTIGRKTMIWKLTASDEVIVDQDDYDSILVPADFAGWLITGVAARIVAADDAADDMDIGIYNVTQTAEILSTLMQIEAGEYSTLTSAQPGVIDTGEDDITAGDVIRIDVDYAGDNCTGLEVHITFERVT